jgi:23S rRNA pseudouridine2605 synthase
MSVAGNTQADAAEKPAGERIAKVIARSGLCSRREAEELILAKRVKLNGELVTSPALDITPGDKVLVDNEPLPKREPPRLWRYHKPKARVTTHKDPEGRQTVFEDLPGDLPRLISVGRLDYNTEGLLLLTNDGELARHLELPATGWARRYRVRAHGNVEQAALDTLAAGITIDGVTYGAIEATLERTQGGNVWIAVMIREGKNREIRRVMDHLGLSVNRLIRVSYGPFMLGDLEPGEIEEVKPRILMDQLGPQMTAELGVEPGPRRPREDKLAAKSAARSPRERQGAGERRAREGGARKAPEYLGRSRAEERFQRDHARSVDRKPFADERAPRGRSRDDISDRARPGGRFDRADDTERPLKTRRILPMDSATGEAPRIEEYRDPPPRRGKGQFPPRGAGRDGKRGERGAMAGEPSRDGMRGERSSARAQQSEAGEYKPRRRPLAKPDFRQREEADLRPPSRGDRGPRKHAGERKPWARGDRGEKPVEARNTASASAKPWERRERPQRGEGGEKRTDRTGTRRDFKPRNEGSQKRRVFEARTPRTEGGEKRADFRPRAPRAESDGDRRDFKPRQARSESNERGAGRGESRSGPWKPRADGTRAGASAPRTGKSPRTGQRPARGDTSATTRRTRNDAAPASRAPRPGGTSPRPASRPRKPEDDA